MLKSSFVHKLQTRNGRVIILVRQIRVLPGYKWDPVTSRNSSTINVLLCLKLNTNERKKIITSTLYLFMLNMWLSHSITFIFRNFPWEPYGKTIRIRQFIIIDQHYICFDWIFCCWNNAWLLYLPNFYDFYVNKFTHL